MRKGSALGELLFVICISTIIACIAGASLIRAGKHEPQVVVGQYCIWHDHKVYLITADTNTTPTTFLIRTEDNKEVRVNIAELTPLLEKQ